VANSASTLTLTNCTISGNSSIASYGARTSNGTTTLGNTIIAGNTGTSTPDAVGSFTSEGNNLIGITDGSSGWVGTDLTGTGSSPLDALLAPLGNYGGPTQTMALLPGSPAIDAGSSSVPGAPSADQRGVSRPQGSAYDIGAFESRGFTIAATSGGGQSAIINQAFANPLVVTVSANDPNVPVAGRLISFTPPGSGASAALTGNPATIAADGTASVTATANGTVGTYTVSATASGIASPVSFSLTNEPLILTPTFSALSSPSIVYGTSTTTLTGHIGSGTSYPSGSNVSITLNSVVNTALVDSGGNFTTSFNTATLGVAGSPYTVTYSFAGNANFSAATDTSTSVTVTPAALSVTASAESKTYGQTVSFGSGSTLFTSSGLQNGESIGSVTLAVSGNGGAPTAAVGSYTITPSAATGGSFNASNYTITYNTGTLTVNPAALTVTASAESKTLWSDGELWQRQHAVYQQRAAERSNDRVGDLGGKRQRRCGNGGRGNVYDHTERGHGWYVYAEQLHDHLSHRDADGEPGRIGGDGQCREQVVRSNGDLR
jgi:hypothetical protein